MSLINELKKILQVDYFSTKIRLNLILVEFHFKVSAMYINRTLEKTILAASQDYSAILLIGPRQVGKSTMLEHLMEGTGRNKVTLDNVEVQKSSSFFR